MWSEVCLPPLLINLKGKPLGVHVTVCGVPEYSFDPGHTIRLRIFIWDGYFSDIILKLESESRHSKIEPLE
jgi:hypothetical protein